MKKNLILIIMSTFILTSCNDNKKETALTGNPFFEEWNTPHQTPPFDKIKNGDYVPAFEEGIKQTRAKIDSIVNNPKAPTFENTIEALERGNDALSKVSSVFFNLNAAETNDEMQNIALKVSPMLTQLHNDISLNDKLFERVKKVYEMRENLNLTDEQKTLLDNTYKGFTRSGANLNEKDREEYRKLTTELGKLTLKFGQNVLAENNAYTLNITDSADLAGIPKAIVEEAAATAKEKNMKGWVFTLQQPSFAPFLKYAENRNLREQIWKAYNRRGANGNEFDNRENIKKIVELRLKIANLLGYKTYADYVLEEHMAKTPENAMNLMNQLLVAAKPYAEKDVEEVINYAKSKGFKGKFMPWDFSFYSEKLKDEKFKITDEMLRPYLKLDNVIDGVFELTNKLYGITYKENKNIPLFNKDVKAYDVFDENGKFLAVLYLDFFPRGGKSGGAWMTSYREVETINGLETRPIVSITCNFTKPNGNTPSLLTFSEFETFLHEFGHALHGMLARGNYQSLTGTNVMRDFVELPSQIMENFCVEKEFLDLFAKHYKTGEKIPQDLINKIVASRNFLEGYLTLRQLGFGLLDMAYHSVTKPIDTDIYNFEKNVAQKTQLLPEVDSCLMSTAFSHIFSGGYAAGYYGYKWAEVLDADAFSMFKKNGIFDKNTAQSFRKNILEKGGEEHPGILYKRFRGQDPTVDALLIRCGFKKK